MIRFIHTADIHFGVENYGKLDIKTGIHSRLLDFERALNACIDKAIAEEVDFFLFSGDAYKTAHPSPTQQRLLTRCFLRLYQAKIPIVIVVGNHDNPLSFGKANSLEIFEQFPVDGFHVIAKPDSFVLPTKSGPIQIVGMPWPTRNTITISNKHLFKSPEEITNYISNAVGRLIKSYAEKLDPTIPAVLAGHLTVSSGIFSGSEKRAIYGTDPVLLPSQLALPPFDYVALGHLHRYQNLNPSGYPAVVYSGSIERVDFGERKENKGFCLVTIHEKNKTTHEFIKTPVRPFIQLTIKLKPGIDQTKQIVDEINNHNTHGAVIKIIYHVPEGKADTVDIKAVQRACGYAIHVAGIIPVRTHSARERRAAMKVTMSFEDLLRTYFESKPELADAKNSVIDLALKLYNEVQKEEIQ